MAETIAHPANGLHDVRLRSVRVSITRQGVTSLHIEADWVSRAGTLTPIGLREQLVG